jgi:LmbE family N-acetylglucosaminyl deacetylase
MDISGRRVLFLGAHPDDIELGCGALVHSIAGQTDVLCVTLSDNQNSAALKNLLAEQRQAMAVLGVPENRSIVGRFATRSFPDARQDILDYLLAVRRDFRPDMVFVHSQHDIHQDHQVVTNESLRAFSGITVLGFEVIRSSHGFAPNFIAEVSEIDVTKKVEALACYATYRDRAYFDDEVTRATVKHHGALAGRPYAEGFELLRGVVAFRSAGVP